MYKNYYAWNVEQDETQDLFETLQDNTYYIVFYFYILDISAILFLFSRDGVMNVSMVYIVYMVYGWGEMFVYSKSFVFIS